MKRKMMFTFVLAFMPAALVAQASGQVAAQANASADASLKAPRGWTAEGSAKLEAMYNDAKGKDLPREPIARRVAEGSAKGASETTILASAAKVKANMESTHEAMVDAGRKNPTHEETARGATAMEHGVTRGQIEALARRTPSDRSLVVAFDVLTRLTARGVPVEKALAQVQAKLDARATDASLIALAAQGGAAGGVGGSMSGRATGDMKSGVSTTTAGSATGTAKGVTAGVTGAVTGVVKRP